MNSRILRLALPNIVTNITVPLLGMVDMAIVGHLSSAHIGAVTIGTSIFNLIYWNFGFLRMATSGLAAQAYGANDAARSVAVLVQSAATALAIALLLIGLQWPLSRLIPVIFKGSDSVLRMATTYFFIRIWAAPATLGLYAIKGWFIGMQDSVTPMWIAIAINLVNIAGSLLLVYGLHLDIAGVALGTVAAQYSGLLLAIAMLRRRFRRSPSLPVPSLAHIGQILRQADIRPLFRVSSDIFLRTLCLSAVFTFITAASGRISDTVLAVDALMLQFFTLFSYIMDGFAYAGESLVGRYIGAKALSDLKQATRLLLLWGAAITAIFTLVYATCGTPLLRLFTPDTALIGAACHYMGWVIAIPVCGCAAFLLDGIYVGATASHTMRNAMFAATATFFALYFGLKQAALHGGTLTPHLWNNILWLAFMAFLVLRGLLQGLRLRRDIYHQAL